MSGEIKYGSKRDPSEYKNEYDSFDDERKMKTIMNPGHVDEAKWTEAKKISEESYGEHKWPFIHWMYERLEKK